MKELYNETPELSTTSDNYKGESIMPENPDIGDSGFFAILPGNVLYDSNLTPNAKLLYAAITTMTKKHGYCYASNKWFANPEHFDKTPHTISQWVAELEQHGYIRTEITHRPNGQILGRKIYTSLSFSVSADDGQGMYKNLQGYVEKSTGVCTKIYSNNNSSNNNINNNKGNMSSESNEGKMCPYAACMNEFHCKLTAKYGSWSTQEIEKVMAAFEGFAEMRHKRRKPITTGRSVTLLCNKLVDFAPNNPDMMAALLDEATEKGWQSVVNPKNRSSAPVVHEPENRNQGRDKEWL